MQKFETATPSYSRKLFYLGSQCSIVWKLQLHTRFSLVFEGSERYDGACAGHFQWVEGDDALYLLANTFHKENIFVKFIPNK